MDKFHKVPVTKILKLEPLENSHSLSLATVYGFQVVVQRDKFSVGQDVIYIPIDSILPENIESILFGKDAKIKLEKGRVRQIKLRGAISQGILATPAELGIKKYKLEDDVGEKLNITKYEPPVKNTVVVKGGRKSKKKAHPDFTSYNGLTNVKWLPHAFDGKEVVVQEKVHGTAGRFGLLPYRADTLLKKLKKFFGLTPTHEFVYGSNNVDISSAASYKGFYDEDIYGKVFNKINAHLKVEPNEIVYGEIIGPGIQKGYSYGLTEHKFLVYDVKLISENNSDDVAFLNPDQVEAYCSERDFEMVPTIYRGKYDFEKMKSMASGPSVYCPAEKVMEGVVIKVRGEYSILGQKQAVKIISEAYLADKNNTDFN